MSSKQPTLPETEPAAEEQATRTVAYAALPEQGRPAKRVQDPEVQAMAAITEAIEKAIAPLVPPARDRVFRWVGERFFGQEPPL